jgi:hypothetical protein
MTTISMTPRVRRIALISAALLAAAGALLIAAGPFSVGALERRLEANAEEALIMRGHSWASVRFEGQRAILAGAAPSDVARADALATVASSTWSGGRIAGGVTRVTDETVEARFERGFVFRADAAMNGRVLIRGDATDARAREAIVGYAEDNFPNGADADLTLVPGGSASPDWQAAAMRLLGQLARLERGSIVLQGETGALIGEAANPQVAQSVAAALSNMPAGYRAAWLVTPAGAPAVSRIADSQACAAVIRAAQGTEILRFEREGADPSPLTAVALRRVGRTFSACPSDAVLEVGVLREAQRAGLDAERLDEVRLLVGQGVTENPRISVRLVQDQDGAITFSISTLEE